MTTLTIELDDDAARRLEARARRAGHGSLPAYLRHLADAGEGEAAPVAGLAADPPPDGFETERDEVLAEVARRQNDPLDLSLTMDDLAEKLCSKFGWDRRQFERERRGPNG